MTRGPVVTTVSDYVTNIGTVPLADFTFTQRIEEHSDGSAHASIDLRIIDKAVKAAGFPYAWGLCYSYQIQFKHNSQGWIYSGRLGSPLLGGEDRDIGQISDSTLDITDGQFQVFTASAPRIESAGGC